MTPEGFGDLILALSDFAEGMNGAAKELEGGEMRLDGPAAIGALNTTRKASAALNRYSLAVAKAAGQPARDYHAPKEH